MQRTKAPGRSCHASAVHGSRDCFSAGRAMRERIDYLRNAARIYERSLAVIRAGADLSGFSSEEAEIVVRMVHACRHAAITRLILVCRVLADAARTALSGG